MEGRRLPGRRGEGRIAEGFPVLSGRVRGKHRRRAPFPLTSAPYLRVSSRRTSEKPLKTKFGELPFRALGWIGSEHADGAVGVSRDTEVARWLWPERCRR